MTGKAQHIAEKFLQREWKNLTERERKVINSLINRQQLSHDLNAEFDDKRTLGERVADKVAAFGGSWTFIFIFVGILLSWVFLNTFMLLNRAFDPYPYILLNLFLSMTAALQAPIIMMSQNRQSARDRLDASHDYEINLKAELEIRSLHEKLDILREQKWLELIEIQQRQIKMLEEILNTQISKEKN